MNRSVLMAAAIVLLMAAWMASGMQDDSKPAPVAQQSTQKKALMKVKVRHSHARNVEQLVRVQGQVEANRSILLKAEIDGSVEALMADEGQRLKAGEQLLQITADYRSAQLAEARALLKQRKSDLAASSNLNKRGLQSESKLFSDQAAVQAAEAQLAKIEYELRNTQVVAPFAGVLNSRQVELGDYLKAGDVMAELVDDATVKVTGQVPQHNIGSLEEDLPVDVVLSNGQKMAGRLAFIAPVADSATRSYRVEVQIPNPEHLRIIGLSATLLLPAGEARGHLLPASVLGLDAAGDLQVKLINNENRVSSAIVNIIRTDSDGFWLSGLDDDIRIITTGQDFVSVGEEVDPVYDDTDQTRQQVNVSVQES